MVSSLLKSRTPVPIFRSSRFRSTRQVQAKTAASKLRKVRLWNLLADINYNFEVINEKFEVINEKFEVLNEKFEVLNDKFEVLTDKFEQLDNNMKFSMVLIIITTVSTAGKFLLMMTTVK